MKALLWGIGLLIGVVISAVIEVNSGIEFGLILRIGIPLACAGLGGLIGNALFKNNKKK